MTQRTDPDPSDDGSQISYGDVISAVLVCLRTAQELRVESLDQLKHLPRRGPKRVIPPRRVSHERPKKKRPHVAAVEARSRPTPNVESTENA
jgi:hypothetical protein